MITNNADDVPLIDLTIYFSFSVLFGGETLDITKAAGKCNNYSKA